MTDNPSWEMTTEQLEALKGHIHQLAVDGAVDTGQLYKAFYPRQKVLMMNALDELVKQGYLKVRRGRKAPTYHLV